MWFCGTQKAERGSKCSRTANPASFKEPLNILVSACVLILSETEL